MTDLFPDLSVSPSVPRSYLEFWNSLSRKSTYQYYRPHQARVLELYQGLADTPKNVAISLPTGTGKTVIALSVGRLAQLQHTQRVLYLCPTLQLVAQVQEQARDVGIPVVTLTGPWQTVSANDKALYNSGDSIGIAAYPTLFNPSPKIATPNILILDDIHAAGDLVAAPWAIDVRANEERTLMHEIRAILVTGGREDSPRTDQVTGERHVIMVRSREWLKLLPEIMRVFDGHSTDHSPRCVLRFTWPRLKQKLPLMFCFVSNDEILMRAWIPPTFELAEFNNVSRRIFLSGTLDRWGHIQQLTGVDPVTSLTLPDEAVPIPGRRLILDLNSMLHVPTDEGKVIDMVNRADRSLVLCRNFGDRDKIEADLVHQGFQGDVLGAGHDLDKDVTRFKEAKQAVLVLANRYDGLDLGEGICRILVLWGLPLAVNLQERFSTSSWGLVKAAEFRARQRVHQGLGRCTRTESDSVVVGLVGSDLVEFLTRPDIQTTLPGRLRSEIELCKRLRGSDGLDSFIDACLNGTAAWVDICKKLDRVSFTPPEGLAAERSGADAPRLEAIYHRQMWTENFAGAEATAAGTGQSLADAGADIEAAPWLYLASVAADFQESTPPTGRASARGTRLLAESRSRAAGREWFASL